MDVGGGVMGNADDDVPLVPFPSSVHSMLPIDTKRGVVCVRVSHKPYVLVITPMSSEFIRPLSMAV